MWQTDTVTLQTVTIVNNYGDITETWSDASTVLCDVQDINKELVMRNWGFTDNTEYKQVFDHTLNSGWKVGNQVKYDSEQWRIMLVNRQMAKMGATNHVFVILSKVVG